VRFEREFEFVAAVLPREARRFDESIMGGHNNRSENGWESATLYSLGVNPARACVAIARGRSYEVSITSTPNKNNTRHPQ